MKHKMSSYQWTFCFDDHQLNIFMLHAFMFHAQHRGLHDNNKCWGMHVYQINSLWDGCMLALARFCCSSCSNRFFSSLRILLVSVRAFKHSSLFSFSSCWAMAFVVICENQKHYTSTFRLVLVYDLGICDYLPVICLAQLSGCHWPPSALSLGAPCAVGSVVFLPERPQTGPQLSLSHDAQTYRQCGPCVTQEIHNWSRHTPHRMKTCYD